MSNLPLYDALTKRALENKRRFHMPGHKGKDVFESSLAGAANLDFTELYGTGNLYDGTYPIADAEKLAAQAFGVPDAYFLTGGTTQGIYAATKLLVKEGERVLIDRGCHKSVYRAMALFDAMPVYLTPKTSEPCNIPVAVTAEDVAKALDRDESIRTVVLTCPTYYGVVCDIKAIAKEVHKRGARLLVDQAHGAHFPFTPGMANAVALGADIAVTSLHKTLPALGQAALLTVANGFDPRQVREATSLFGTSSPSYAIMASMDLTREYMEREGSVRCAELKERLIELRQTINKTSALFALNLKDGDPLRLCVCTRGIKLSGYDAAAYLENECGVVCEMADVYNVLFIITPADSAEDIQMLENALYKLANHGGQEELPQTALISLPRQKCTLRQALFANSKQIPLSQAIGKTAAESICPYPPGIPTVALGEVIEREHVEYLYQRGFFPDDPVQVITI